MIIFNRITKYIFLFIALLIVAASLYFTNSLANKLEYEERKQMEVWSGAMRRFNDINPGDTLNFELIWKIIESNKQIPVIIADKHNNIINYVNINNVPKDMNRFFIKKINRFKSQNPPIELSVSDNEKQYIYYDNSQLLKQLEYFPYIQLALITAFLLICFWAFAADKKAEQNSVWVGLSKETAHQLGTPISSLMAWEEILKNENMSQNSVNEIGKDIKRLKTISDRFSKIGSMPALTEENIVKIIENSINYVKQRTSNKVNYLIKTSQDCIKVFICVPLFEWVIENICKNAVDAMSGIGQINFNILSQKNTVIIDITDTGKGIAKKQFKDIFKPGYTTKQRGWGLGLSLSKRIIENYHKGKIFVKSSDIGKKTTFRIILKKSV